MSEKISRLPENASSRSGFTTSLGSATGENLRSELRGFVCVTELLLMDLHVKPTNAEVHLAKEQRLLVAGMVSLSLFLQRILPPPPTPPPLPRDPSAAAAAESGVPSLGEVTGSLFAFLHACQIAEKGGGIWRGLCSFRLQIWGRAMKEKRGLEAAAAGGDGHPEAKRARPPALARWGENFPRFWSFFPFLASRYVWDASHSRVRVTPAVVLDRELGVVWFSLLLSCGV